MASFIEQFLHTKISSKLGYSAQLTGLTVRNGKVKGSFIIYYKNNKKLGEIKREVLNILRRYIANLRIVRVSKPYRASLYEYRRRYWFEGDLDISFERSLGNIETDFLNI